MLSSSNITGLSSGNLFLLSLEGADTVFRGMPYDEDKLNKDTAVLVVHMGHSHVMSRS